MKHLGVNHSAIHLHNDRGKLHCSHSRPVTIQSMPWGSDHHQQVHGVKCFAQGATTEADGEDVQTGNPLISGRTTTLYNIIVVCWLLAIRAFLKPLLLYLHMPLGAPGWRGGIMGGMPPGGGPAEGGPDSIRPGIGWPGSIGPVDKWRQCETLKCCFFSNHTFYSYFKTDFF